MASMSTMTERQASGETGGSLLVSLPAQPTEANSILLGTLHEAFAGAPVVIAVPDASAEVLRAFADAHPDSSLKLATYTPTARPNSGWTLSPADFLDARELLALHPASHVMLLGAEAESLSATGLREMHHDALTAQCDLLTANYSLPPRAGLVNSSMLYPVSRALFGSSTRFPLALDLILSARMTERLAVAGQRAISSNRQEGFIWPVAEASAASFSMAQTAVGARSLPQPPASDLNTLLALVVEAMFTDVEAKAAVWQRVRLAPGSQPARTAVPASAATMDEIGAMIEAFRLAYSNLLEVWALVLPPQSLLGLKRLSAATRETFTVSDALWARIVYDFLVAFRLRTLSRNHLLGALTPLYLAWVASHLLKTLGGSDPERHIQQVAAAFEADKPYLVSRWRWPDRFNP